MPFCRSGVVFYLLNSRVSPELRRAALRVIQDDLKAAGIRIPYPQLDIHPKEPATIFVENNAE